MNLTHKEWEFICSSIDSSRCVTVSELLNLSLETNWIAIKHDVETNVERALAIAKIEAKYSIRATYYIQSSLLESNLGLLNAIQGLGHEVSYHYDVLDSNNGNFKLALLEFERTLKQFKKYGFNIETICPHGNPMLNRSGWNSNKDFFRDQDISKKYEKIFDIVVHGRELLPFDYKYISDAGYSFKIIEDITNNDKTQTVDKPIEMVADLISLINKSQTIIISTHPHRWVSNRFIALLIKARFYVIRKVAILASKSTYLKKLMSKFYYLAKNF